MTDPTTRPAVHACSNCDGVDPGTCLVNPGRPTSPLTPRQDAAVRPPETPAGGSAGTEALEGATGAQAGVQRRERYRAAIRETDGWVLDNGQNMVDAVMAVADAEARAERDRARSIAVELGQQLAAVSALHQPHGGGCGTCADETGQAAAWPCPTARALNPQEDQ